MTGMICNYLQTGLSTAWNQLVKGSTCRPTMLNPKFHATKLLGGCRVLMHSILIDSKGEEIDMQPVRRHSAEITATLPLCSGA